MEYSDDGAQLEQARMLVEAGRLPEALALFQDVVQRKPRDILTRQAAAEVLARMGRTALAVEELAAIALRFAQDGLLLRSMAVCRSALSLDPSHTTSLSLLADVFARKHGRPLPPEELPAPLPPAAAESSQEESLAISRAVVEDALEEELSSESGMVQLPLRELPDTPLFAELPAPAFMDMVRRLRLRHLREGHVVLKEGDAGESMFVILKGSVRVSRAGQVVGTLGRGAFFGEMALLSHAPRMATVEVVEDLVVFELSRAQVEALCGRHPDVARVMEGFHRRRMLHNLVASSPLFALLEPEQRREMVELFAVKAVEPGHVFLEQGQPGTGFHIISSGECQASVVEEDGQQRVLTRMGPGDVFGEVGLLFDAPCTASVAAVGPCTVLRLGASAFKRLVPPGSPAGKRVQALGLERLKRAGLSTILDMDSPG